MVQADSLKKKLLIICGATATGKTSLAVQCAKLLNTEIISADSMNVYTGLNVGTAKPSFEEREGVVHHLIDVASPFDRFTVGDYRELAMPVIDELHKQNKIPVICGGTGFYINSLLYKLSYGNGMGDMSVRNKYKSIAEEKGNEAVHEILKDKDPITAERLHPNDLKRVIRALEIYDGGSKKSDIIDDKSPVFDYDAYCISFPRDELYERIDKRVDYMVEKGLVEEVISLKKQGVTLFEQCMQGIGYKEIFSYLSGELSIEQAIDLIKLNTRHYAKRQITFFKKLPNLTELHPEKTELLAERICKTL